MIIGDPAVVRRDSLRSDALLRAYGRFVDRLGGRYLTAEDVGTTQADMDLIRTVTPHVTGVSEHLGGSGDPSPATAWGVLNAMRAVAERLWGSASLDGPPRRGRRRRQGRRRPRAPPRRGGAAHHRGRRPRRRRRAVAAEVGAVVAAPRTIHRVACDVFSPCALGAC